jgi:hypothetical protein
VGRLSAPSRSSTGDDSGCSRATAATLTRYFPSFASPPGGYVLDGEIVFHGESGRQEFDLLGQRIHPAASARRAGLPRDPAVFIAFEPAGPTTTTAA